ncbi:hypothetical protein CHUAL_002824 [Chamberlinius hualienensis]
MENKTAAIARKRWKLLKEVLRTGQIDSSADESVRSFQGFGLFSQRKCYSEGDCEWFEYSSPTFESFRVIIRHCSNAVTLDDLSGFNNTGNVGLWPAEEILAYYCLKHKHMFSGKTVCELGGGMTCLAGIAIWSSCDCRVVVSDGNDRSVQNLQMIADRNAINTVGSGKIAVKQIRWGSSYPEQRKDLQEKFDFVLCADCLFFKETVDSLADLIYTILKPEGLALIIAPSRTGTFDHFYGIVKDKFKTEVIQYYDELVEELHHKNLKDNPYYRPDIHYPLMMRLTKL